MSFRLSPHLDGWRGTRGHRGDARRAGPLGLDAGVPRRQGQAQDIGQHASVAVGDGAAERGDLGRKGLLAGDHLLQPREPPRVLRGRHAFEHEPVDQPPGEPHPHPHPDTRSVVEVLRDGVVEEAVEVRERDVDGDPRHR